jgi:hypothetical protein
MFQYSANLGRRVKCDRHSVRQTSSIVYRLSSRRTDIFFSHLQQSNLKMSYLNFQNLKQLCLFKGLFYTHGFITKGLLKHFISLRSCFLKVKSKLNANYQSLNVCHFTGLQQLQNVLNTKALTWKLPSIATLCYSYAHHITLTQPHPAARGTRWRSWLRHYATSRKAEGSIPDGRTMALGSTQSLTEMSTRNI